MSAETLRQAATLMRERALAASNPPWTALTMFPTRSEVTNETEIDGGVIVQTPSKDDFDVEHIASWHPAVALTVADWLDAEADALDARNAAGEGRPRFTWHHAIAVASAYLDEEDR